MTFALASLAFVLSGFAALVYQIAWQRLLVLPMGADIYATTLIVTAFMCGLGLGSLVGGQIADRLTRRQNLFMFIGAELAVGVFGLGSRTIFYDYLYLRLSTEIAASSALVPLMFAGLLWPTFWMGVSLPLLARAVSVGVDGAPRSVGGLYALNTLGAAAGAFASTWLLIPEVGLDGTIRAAALMNLAAAGVVLMPALAATRSRDTARIEIDHRPVRPGVGADREPAWRFRTWAWLYAIAGFQALSLEILWFRLLGITLKSSAFTFGTLLTIYLAGLAIGAALESLFLHRVRRPALAFLGLQGFISLYALVSISALIWYLPSSSELVTLREYVSGYDPIDAAAAFEELMQSRTMGPNQPFVLLYLVLPALLVGPPTIAMGASFPLLQKVVIQRVGHVGRRVGTLLVANIAGSTLGSVATGWLALTYLGSATSLKALAAISGMFVVLAASVVMNRAAASRRAAAMIASAAAFVAAIAAAPEGARLWASLHGTVPRLILHGEDASGVSIIKVEPRVFGTRGVVFVNGIGQSWIPYGNIHSVLGALPAFTHPNPRTAAVIGLGSGDTLYSLAGRQELERVTSVEIIRSQLDTLREWERRQGYPALTAMLSDPRVEHVFGDGRIHVMRSARRFDIIEADALRPTSAFSGNLYSVGYFELLRSRLNEGGLAVTWAPTSRIHDTFASVFPYSLDFGDIVMGSGAPITFDAETVRARLRAPLVRAYYERAGMNIEQLLAPYLDRAPRATKAAGGPDDDLNEDLFPRDEFSVGRRPGAPR